jgi:hypothetical protein
MTESDHQAAAAALIDWLESQSIDPSDAVIVLTTAIVALVRSIAKQQHLNPRNGGEIVARMIKANFDD